MTVICYQTGRIYAEMYVPEAESVCVELIAVRGKIAEIESFDLAVSSANVRGQWVDVRSASATDQ